MTLDERKARAYDKLVEINQLQNLINVKQGELSQLNQEVLNEQAEKAKEKKE